MRKKKDESKSGLSCKTERSRYSGEKGEKGTASVSEREREWNTVARERLKHMPRRREKQRTVREEKGEAVVNGG